jgi:hypothetical protein
MQGRFSAPEGLFFTPAHPKTITPADNDCFSRIKHGRLANRKGGMNPAKKMNGKSQTQP